MIKFVLAALILGSGAAQAKSLDTQGWATLMRDVQAKGERQLSDMYTTQYFERVQPNDKTRTHHARYFSLFNVNTEHGTYPRSTAITDENWVLNESGNWEIDQWLFEANLHGELKRVGHYQIEESPDHIILKWKALLFTSNMTAELNDQFLEVLSAFLTPKAASPAATPPTAQP